MCDTMVALPHATATGTTLFGKNSDRDYREAQLIEIIPRATHEPDTHVRLTHVSIEQVRETHAIVISRPHWIWGAEIGANDTGLTIGNEAIFSTVDVGLEPGVIGMDYVRLALERATDVDEAADVITTLLRRHGQGGNCGFERPLAYHNSFLLADKKEARVLETIDREWVLRTVSDREAISNTITTEVQFDSSSDTLLAYAFREREAPRPREFSFKATFIDDTRSESGRYRRERAARLLAESPSLQPRDLFAILRDHEEGPSSNGREGPRICTHRRTNPIGQTTASWVSDIAPGRVVHWVTATAAPCTGVFKPLLLEVGLPAHGPPPGAREDDTSLWWRHERLRRQMATCGDNRVADFIAERDALEAKFLAMMADCPADADTRRVAQQTTTECWQAALAFEATWSARLS